MQLSSLFSAAYAAPVPERPVPPSPRAEQGTQASPACLYLGATLRSPPPAPWGAPAAHGGRRGQVRHPPLATAHSPAAAPALRPGPTASSPGGRAGGRPPRSPGARQRPASPPQPLLSACREAAGGGKGRPCAAIRLPGARPHVSEGFLLSAGDGRGPPRQQPRSPPAAKAVHLLPGGRVKALASPDGCEEPVETPTPARPAKEKRSVSFTFSPSCPSPRGCSSSSGWGSCRTGARQLGRTDRPGALYPHSSWPEHFYSL